MNVNQWGAVNQWYSLDANKPVITLIGSPTVTITEGDTYTDAGATANDDVDGDITANIVTVNPVDENTVGTYTVTYNVSDSSGNEADEVTRTVNVEAQPDTTKPVITLLGSPTVTITEGDAYTDAGATANDDVDGDITANIVTVNPVDENTVGTYTVTYNVSDSSGNAADEVTRTVNVESSLLAPTANAGGNKSVQAGAGVILDGSGSTDSDGTIVAWLWEELTNSGVVLQGAETDTVSFIAPEQSYSQNIRLQLTVTDNDGLSDNDSVTVTVAAKQTGGGGSALASSYRHGVYVTEVPTRRKFK